LSWLAGDEYTGSDVTSSHRILYVHNSADIYGASRSLLRLLHHLKGRGYVPMVLLPEEGPLKTRLEGLGVEVLVDRWLTIISRSALGPLSLLKLLLGFPVSLWRVRRLIVRNKIELVHTNTGVIVSSALAGCLAGVPHIWHVRDSFLEFRSLWKFYRRYITGFSRKVLCVSNAIAAQFPGARNVEVVYNGLPLEEFEVDAPALRAQFRSARGLGEELVVGCVGRIKLVRKGQEVFVRAAARLKQRGLRAKYLIVGTTFPGLEDHEQRLRQMIREAGLVDDVVFTGELADVRPAYAAMDVFVLPSAQPEPFGGVVLEAMAMERPVIATAIGGSLDQVEEGRTGFLVPPSDAEALADKLALLLQDAPLRSVMGRAGRERLENCFAIGPMFDKIEAAYRNALRK
jgi:glycosyltransferase involved in cell wall biosynthesis